jgi:hypothetical protein
MPVGYNSESISGRWTTLFWFTGTLQLRESETAWPEASNQPSLLQIGSWEIDSDVWRCEAHITFYIVNNFCCGLVYICFTFVGFSWQEWAENTLRFYWSIKSLILRVTAPRFIIKGQYTLWSHFYKCLKIRPVPQRKHNTLSLQRSVAKCCSKK